MRALVIGYGSIGARHARLLAALGCDTAVVSARDVDHPARFATLSEGLAKHRPGYVVLASATHLHDPQLAELQRLGFDGTTLVEKPLFDSALAAQAVARGRVFVAYNLRFHPLIARLREALRGERVLSVQAYAGQYLPEWRPGTDYRKSYSAQAGQGGGVLRDLSHELDYLTWMLCGWTRVTALGGHFSDLEIDSDDVFACLFATPSCPAVSVQVNYLDRVGRRNVLINTDSHTFELDFVRGTLARDREVEKLEVERDHTYRAMHGALLAGDTAVACSFEEGLRTLRLIDAARSASTTAAWVTHG
jgi:predicted dehydrogenase